MQVIPFLFATDVVQAKDNTVLNYKSRHSMLLLRNQSSCRFYVTNCTQPRSLIQWLGDGFSHHFKNSKKVAVFKIKKKKCLR